MLEETREYSLAFLLALKESSYMCSTAWLISLILTKAEEPKSSLSEAQSRSFAVFELHGLPALAGCWNKIGMAITAIYGIEKHKGRAAVDRTCLDAWQQLEIRQSIYTGRASIPVSVGKSCYFQIQLLGFLVLSLETYLAIKAKRSPGCSSIFHKV